MWTYAFLPASSTTGPPDMYRLNHTEYVEFCSLSRAQGPRVCSPSVERATTVEGPRRDDGRPLYLSLCNVLVIVGLVRSVIRAARNRVTSPHKLQSEWAILH